MFDRRRDPRALVIGLTIHGLAVARALARAGIQVDVLAQGARWRNPATFTRYARVHTREGLNTPALREHLLAFARSAGDARPIVLFPTSDRMVGTVARHWPDLADRYRLSWAHCRDLVLELQDKGNLPAYASRAGVPHPRSVVILPTTEPRQLVDLAYPLVVKPTRPLGSFKALRADDVAAVIDIKARYPAELPFVAQELVEGGADSLWAATFYLDHGREVGALVSRKLAASPPGFGQGTVFATAANPEVLALARRFLSGLDLSGPVAVEFKQDPAGRYWLIEPNAGRTEYCVDLAIQSGLNLPLIEYQRVVGVEPGPVVLPGTPVVWLDTDKDPACAAAIDSPAGPGSTGNARRIYPFAGHGDPGPAVAKATLRAAEAAWHLLRRPSRSPERGGAVTGNP